MHKVKSTHKVVLTNYSRFGSIILAKEEAPVKDSEQYFINKAIRSLRIWFSKKKLLMSQAQDLQRQLAEAWREKDQLEAENAILHPVLITARSFIKSVREPIEPSNLAKSPVAAWLFADELKKAVEVADDHLREKT